MRDQIPRFLLKSPPFDSIEPERRARFTPFVDRGIRHLREIIRSTYSYWDSSSRNGLFQKIDPRVKLFFLIFFVIIVSLRKDVESQLGMGLFVFFLVWASRLTILDFYKKVLLLGFIFGFLIGLPSAFNLFARGEVIYPILRLSRPYGWWIYQIPQEIGITREGQYGLAMLCLRVANSLSLVFLVLHTTRFPEVMKALKTMRIPDAFLVIATLSHKYFVLFARTLEEMHLAKKSRWIGKLSHRETRRWAAGRIAFLFLKTRQKGEETFKAMLSRGFSDTVKVYSFPKLTTRDWITGVGLCLVGIFFLWI